MGITRRNFIASIIGGVVGIQVTPLPWKFTDDVAIWTQNWPWVPVPPVGECTDVSSVCNLCPGGCGIAVRKVDERAVKIEGRTDYPVNPGGICPVGMGGLQLLYDESLRFTGPMKRVGLRGAEEFVNIGWNEAYDILARRIAGLRKKGRPEAVAAVDGNRIGSTVALMIERLMKAVGSPNYLRTSSIEDTYQIGNLLMQGAEAPMRYDLENSDYVLSFGCGLLEGWGAPGRVMNTWGLWHEHPMKRKTKIAQVESRASNTASKADYWVAPRPGTEASLALGIAHVIIRDGLYDARFVEDQSFGFDDWISSDGRDHIGFKTMVLRAYPPDKVAKTTGVSTRVIVSLARGFAKAKAPIAIYGKGKDSLNGGLYEFMAVQSLNALVGSINRPGGVLFPEPLPLTPLPPLKLDTIAGEGMGRPRFNQAQTIQYPFTQGLISNLTEAVLKTAKSPVDTLLVFSANPVFTQPDGGGFREALKRIPFIVSFSPFRDETARMADLILPDHTYLEKMDDVVWPVGLQYPLYGLSKPVVEPVYDTRNTGDAIIGLSKVIGESVGRAFAWANFEEVLETRAKGLFDAGGGIVSYDPSRPPWKWQAPGNGPKPGYKTFDEMWEKMKSGGLWYRPLGSTKGVPDSSDAPSGKFEFFCKRIDEAVQGLSGGSSRESVLKELGVNATGDVACMPHYEAEESAVDRSSYPLSMVPYEMINLASGWIPSPPFLYKTLFDNQLLRDESFAAINPKTAAKYHLNEGDQALVKSPVGEVRVRVNLFEGAMPGIVYLPLGFGHTAYDEFLKGKGVNPNNIVEAGKDPMTGNPVWWNTRVKLIKV